MLVYVNHIFVNELDKKSEVGFSVSKFWLLSSSYPQAS